MKGYLSNTAIATVLAGTIAISGTALAQNQRYDRDREMRERQTEAGYDFDREYGDGEVETNKPYVHRRMMQDNQSDHRDYRDYRDRGYNHAVGYDRDVRGDRDDFDTDRTEVYYHEWDNPHHYYNRVDRDQRDYQRWNDDDYRYYRDQVDRYDQGQAERLNDTLREGYNRPSLRTSAGYDKNPDGDSKPDKTDENRYRDHRYNTDNYWDDYDDWDDDSDTPSGKSEVYKEDDLNNPRHRGGTAQVR